MARFVVWSDLHMEFEDFDLPHIDAFGGPIDGVLLGGDIDTGRSLAHVAFAERVYRAYQVPVVMILGNHEYYGCLIDDLEGRQAERLEELQRDGCDVRILNGDSVVIAGARIVGATLWTDLQLNPSLGPASQYIAERLMNDFKLIRIDMDAPRRLMAKDTVDLHARQKAAVLSELKRSFNGPTIVMTHHMPIAQAVHVQYRHDPLSAAFASDLLEEIRGLDFDAWIYGHSHANYEYEIVEEGRLKRFVSNPRGYPEEQTRFDPVRTLVV